MAKLIDLKQGDENWLAWRKFHIMATDSSKILGRSRFGTPLTCYQSKIEGLKTEVTPVMIRGQEKEIEARAYLSEMLGVELKPACFESEEIPYLAASLDAVSNDRKQHFEIKSMGVEKAKNREIEDDTMIQMQHQMLVNGWDYHTLCAWQSKENYFLLPIEADPLIQGDIKEAAKNFWNKHLIPKIPPDPIDKDCLKNGDENINGYASRLRALKNEERALKEEMIELEGLIKTLTKEHSTIFTKARVKMSVYSKKGTVDWKGVCNKWNIAADELEKFRKEKQTAFRFTFF